ncbi:MULTISPECIES: aminotransferase class V-fold PLP-dependent enzyme [unclassified Crossiella]|uniref:aminotransferase class V-fold PLP-dependent enzyme n=1 Tax=unclassified Crossiella TaxID=2620835 RepID=UPI001FFE33F8|nr:MULTISPECIES: aminotransferase class V-fold PLP-dependent enzyme [unclassified Crossiella]MCK2242817.1 aminotransferase class V-fold PLP-dependent enzyme [Crossiella sp. S99.2]MCK2256694.1 aminotransferase class V-fold PLP-dependent enzyme [Crossiella sp. S99.1]
MRDHDSAIALDLAALRADTPGCESVVHFNNAGCGLLARPVLAAMQEHLDLEARIGGYEASAAQAGQVRDFYAALAELINCKPENIAFAGSATHAYTKALSAIPFERGDVILTTRNDFISNQIAFLALRKRFGVEVVHAPDHADGTGVDVEAMAALMRTRRPRLVAVTHVPTNSGLVQPIAEIGRHCRELGLLYLVDACQTVGQFEIDVEEIGCDLLSSTCRKYLRGPRGSGFLYVSDRVLREGYEPLFIDMYGARWVEPGRYQPVASAARFEEWEFPYSTLLGCAAAARYALKVGMAEVERYSPALGADLRARLAEVPGVRVLDRGPRLSAMVTFAIAGWDSAAFKTALDQRGINSALSFRELAQFDFADKQVDWALRLSPHYYNTQDEVAQVAAAVAELAA